MLALVTLKRAVEHNDIAFATRVLAVLEKAAAGPSPDAHLVEDYAEGAFVLATVHQDRSAHGEIDHIMTAARSALRSSAAHTRWLERGGESGAAQITAWLDSVDSNAIFGA